jgi:hypothetical protein
MRKQRATRPRLESMEVRLFPSALGVAIPAAQVLAIRAARLEAHAAHGTPAHVTRSHGTTRDHHAVKHANAGHHATSGSTKSNSLFSNFFNSIFGHAF